MKQRVLNNTDIDVSHRSSLNTVFGDKIVGQRVPSLGAVFQYGIPAEDINITVTGTGAVTTENSMLKASTGASTNSKAQVQSSNYVRYIPGSETYALFTAVFTQAVEGVEQKVGLYDDNDGFYLKYDINGLKLRRRRKGTDYEYPSKELNAIFEGYDVTKGNVYRISYGYLGFAPVHFEIMNPLGDWRSIGEINYPNTATETHIAQTHLPLRAEVENTTNNTDITMFAGSVSAGVVDGSVIPGGMNDTAARFFTKSGNASASSGFVLAFKSKDTYNGIENRISSLLKLISCATDGTKNVSFKILKNPTFSIEPNFVDVDTDSVLQIGTGGTLSVGAENGDTFLEWNMGKVDKFFEDVSGQNLLLKPGGVAVFYFGSASSVDVNLSIRWAELF